MAEQKEERENSGPPTKRNEDEDGGVSPRPPVIMGLVLRVLSIAGFSPAVRHRTQRRTLLESQRISLRLRVAVHRDPRCAVDLSVGDRSRRKIAAREHVSLSLFFFFFLR